MTIYIVFRLLYCSILINSQVMLHKYDRWAPCLDHIPKALMYGTHSQGISQFYLHTPHSSANGMSHTCLYRDVSTTFWINQKLINFNNRSRLINGRTVSINRFSKVFSKVEVRETFSGRGVLIDGLPSTAIYLF